MVFISPRAHCRGLVDDFGARRYLRQGRLQDSGHWNKGTSLVGHAGCGRRALQVMSLHTEEADLHYNSI